MRIDAEIVATGDELMTGAVQDTNSSLVCRRLRETGVSVRQVTIVGDPIEDIQRALREASARARIVVVSGGLGPTEDDRTAEAAATLAGVPLERNAAALEHVASMFRRFGREMTPNNAKQADFPKGAEILDNPVGTAPGFAMDLGGARAFFMPGVPRELTKMLEEQVLPRVAAIRAAAGETTALATRVVKTYGHGESKVETELAGIAWPKAISVGYRAKFPEIHLRLYAEGPDGTLSAALARSEAAIRQRLGVRVFGVDAESMPSVLGALVQARGWRLALAESCTGGLLGSLLTEVPGASAWFDRGSITYSNEAKVKMLGVSADTIARNGAVSEETAAALAVGARESSGCGIAISITGIAGPSGGTPEKPVGTVFIGCAMPDGVETRALKLFGDRERVRLAACFAAMDLARRKLLGTRDGG